jgi:hypothetical protein
MSIITLADRMRDLNHHFSSVNGRQIKALRTTLQRSIPPAQGVVAQGRSDEFSGEVQNGQSTLYHRAAVCIALIRLEPIIDRGNIPC